MLAEGVGLFTALTVLPGAAFSSSLFAYLFEDLCEHFSKNFYIETIDSIYVLSVQQPALSLSK
jgi:hypothetical protein